MQLSYNIMQLWASFWARLGCPRAHFGPLWPVVAARLNGPNCRILVQIIQCSGDLGVERATGIEPVSEAWEGYDPSANRSVG